ncbi:heat shock 70 kDa protein 4-like isoform X2 [Paramacrobiotus metropolitanus]|nr:heat shock 70 kDa protein 4-like isoform X2 [Paramacrobiotus metropolitanus]XP_055339854.1 heat shock 70 kDa protein 4-like isoform X2 [Paramacrobiotus metropolitanus]XP_055339855.1 heat shock 70 kDa protein 4-like isoform X2 [Paramacrobiotus metropolitanus]
MSVIGIDFGNQNCFVATARAGGIELILNDYSMRDTPAYVSFHERNRSMGVSARSNLAGNLMNTVFNFKRLLGRKFRDPMVQEELKYIPYSVIETADGGIGVKVSYMEKDSVFTPEQVVGMFLGKLKAISEADLKVPVSDCVISVPVYFTDIERRALLTAAQIGGLNVLRLMNEPTAVALCYGLYAQELPDANQPARNVVFIDVGYATTQMSAVGFNKGKLKVLGAVVDPTLGGRNFDYTLVNHFADAFKKQYKIDVYTNKRALMRLRDECEKLKKMMSSIGNEIPLNIECFMNDKDVHGKMKRDDFEALIADELVRLEEKMRELVDVCKLDGVDRVEIVGGSVRIPAIKALIKKVFGVEPSTSLNQDEAVSRGCAIQCAILSPTLKVKEFAVADVISYGIEVRYGDKTGARQTEVFPKNHEFPFTKVVTFSRNEPFSLDAHYSGNQSIPHSDSWIGKFQIHDVVPTPGEATTKVRVKTRVGLNGMFAVTGAYREEIVLVEDSAPAVQVQPMDTDQAPNEGAENQTKMDVDEKKEDVKKTKKQSKQIELRVEAVYPEYPPKKVQEFVETEMEMRSQDKAEKEKADARNALEEYIYEYREKISESGPYYEFVTEKDRERFGNMLRSSEDWLYSEGEDQPKSAYAAKLNELKDFGAPVANRYKESQDRDTIFEDWLRYLQLTRKAVDSYNTGDEKFSHIDNADIQKVAKAVEDKQRWIEEKMAAQKRLARHVDPAVTVAQIKKEREGMESLVNPILNKPKPAAPKPPPEQPKKADEAPPSNGNEAGEPADIPMDTQ